MPSQLGETQGDLTPTMNSRIAATNGPEKENDSPMTAHLPPGSVKKRARAIDSRMQAPWRSGGCRMRAPMATQTANIAVEVAATPLQ
jgi:hypothetical protein